MKALVIHPRFSVYGGGELLSLYTCQALMEAGYETTLVADTYDELAAERIYGLGSVLKEVKKAPIAKFNPWMPKGMAMQRVMMALRHRGLLNSLARENPDVIFSTQSSIYNIPSRQVYHFVYDMADLFQYPYSLADASPKKRKPSRMLYYKMLSSLVPREERSKARFFALASNILEALKSNGYANSELVYPPCPRRTSPGRKHNSVIQVTRLVPQKRLEIFLEVARRLPRYNFFLVGRDDPILRRFNPGYSKKLMQNLPGNLSYIESPIKECPWLLASSNVYLYTGIEPGIGIALVEGIMAGCVPVAPKTGGGGEVVRATIGEEWTFDSVDEAVALVRKAMDSHLDPEEIAATAKPFSVQAFKDKIKMITDGNCIGDS